MINFVTESLIDLDFIRSFGVNVKDSDNPIGYFGTGLKYAIAVLLRNGASVTMYRDGATHQFSLREKELRGKTFRFVYMDDEQLAFTDELGKNWESWEAMRELYCNTLDGKGSAIPGCVDSSDMRSKTVFHITGADAAWTEFETTGLLSRRSRLIGRSKQLEIYAEPSQYLYAQGIRVYTSPYQAQFTYNLITRPDLTENRTLRDGTWEVQKYVAPVVATLTNKDDILPFILAAEGTFEKGSAWSVLYLTHATEEFNNVVAEAIRQRRNVNTHLRTAFLSLHGRAAVLTDDKPLNNIQCKQLRKAKHFCKKVLDADIERYTIKLTEDLRYGILGAVEKDTILVSEKAFAMGTKTLAGTIYEEYLHLTHELHDESRELQNHLIDQIVSLGEQLQGEPL